MRIGQRIDAFTAWLLSIDFVICVGGIAALLAVLIVLLAKYSARTVVVPAQVRAGGPPATGAPLSRTAADLESG
jgi:hypothetical protein